MAVWRTYKQQQFPPSAPVYLTYKNMAIAFNYCTNLFTFKVKGQMENKGTRKKNNFI